MEKNIEKILNDIYQIDVSFREHEDKLRQIIKELIESRPDTKFDEEFARELRVEVMRRAGELKKEATAVKQGIFSQFMWANKLAYAMGGAAIVLVLAIPIINLFDQDGRLVKPEKLALDISSGISRVGDQAFGSLSSESITTLNEEATKGRGDGGTATAVAPMQEADAEFGEATRTISPEFINYEYAYVGDELKLDREEMEVFKRIKGSAGGSDLAKLIGGINFSLFDLEKFKNAEITNLNVSEDRDFGFALHLNMAENSLDIFKNWEKWPQPNADCADPACWERNRLKINDVPADEKIIAMADKFIKDYGLDMNYYGEPIIQDYWRRQYEQSESKSQVWIPDEITVIYPLIINEQIVYDEGGNPTGLSISVDIRNKRASGAHTIVAQTYEGSSYETETDASRIIELAEQGGLRRMFSHDSPSKVITIELDTPTLGLMRHWQHNTTSKQPNELYIPALVFPIKSMLKQANNYYQKNIIIPLVKEVLDQFSQEGPVGPIPRPMPLLEKIESVEIFESPAVPDERDE